MPAQSSVHFSGCPLAYMETKWQVPNRHATWLLTMMSSNPPVIPRRKFCPYLRTWPTASLSALSGENKNSGESLRQDHSTTLFLCVYSSNFLDGECLCIIPELNPYTKGLFFWPSNLDSRLPTLASHTVRASVCPLPAPSGVVEHGTLPELSSWVRHRVAFSWGQADTL